MSKSSERRDGPRIDLRLRVRYAVESFAGEAEASDVSPKGLRFESDVAMREGAIITFSVDAGEEEALEAQGHITWCRPRESPLGKTIYEIGVACDSGLLAQKRGPLGKALARIFAMNDYEPARSFERTAVSFRAASGVGLSTELEIVDLSRAGMRLCAKQPLQGALSTGDRVQVVIALKESTHTLYGQVAWTAGAEGPAESARVDDSFGVYFPALAEDDGALLETIRLGEAEPGTITLSRSPADG